MFPVAGVKVPLAQVRDTRAGCAHFVSRFLTHTARATRVAGSPPPAPRKNEPRDPHRKRTLSYSPASSVTHFWSHRCTTPLTHKPFVRRGEGGAWFASMKRVSALCLRFPGGRSMVLGSRMLSSGVGDVIVSTQDATDAGIAAGRKRVIPKGNRPVINTLRKMNEEHEKKAADMKLGWRVVSSAVLHRYPTITQDSEQWERDMWTVQDKIEDQKRAHFMSQVAGTEAQMIPDDNPSYEEIVESLPFKPASRTTEADLKNDRRSMERKLQNSLFLVVKRNRSTHSWQFPQGKLLDTEDNLRASAERVLDRAVGKTKRFFISNAPIGHYCYAYPSEMQQQRKQYGAKIFFYRAQLIAGTVKLETRLYTDLAWISRSEVGEYFDKDTAAAVEAFLPF